MEKLRTGARQAVLPTAAAIPGREFRIKTSFEGGYRGPEPFKNVSVTCSSKDKRVVGGGVVIDDGNRNKVRLVGLVPSTYNGKILDSFTVSAEAPELYSPYDWSLYAYIICVDAAALSRYQIISNGVRVPSTGGPYTVAWASCPNSAIVYGGGAFVISDAANPGRSFAGGQIGLQSTDLVPLIRANRVSARERAEGHFLSWSLISYAICAEGRGNNMNFRSTASSGAEAKVLCDSGWDVIGPGGGVGSDLGPVWLQRIIPTTPQGVIVTMTGPVTRMGASATCALR